MTAKQNGTWQAGAVVYGNTVAPVVPVLVSSVINNAAPSILEMTYSLTLANIIPQASSFVTKVNGINRSVTSVAISGNKVNLTIPEELGFGDIVSVSYVKPATNPLQSDAGVAAETITAQPVTNKVVGYTTQSTDTSNKEKISVYPNPAREFINISNLEPSLGTGIIRIYDFSGKLCMETRLDTGLSNKIPINLKTGIYVVKVEIGSIIRLVQKLVVLD